MQSIAKSRPRAEFCCDDPNITPAAGLASVAELDRVIGIIATIDEQERGTPESERPEGNRIGGVTSNRPYGLFR